MDGHRDRPPLPQKTYTLQTVVRDWFNSGVLDAAAAGCGVGFVTELSPDQDPRHIACIVEAIRTAGLDESTLQFFTDTHLLLSDFHLHGRVDIGYAVAPWVNMGRPQAVFLNGDPAALPIFSLDRRLYDAWQTAPGAAELKRRYPNLGLWTEYSREGNDEPLPEGGQRLVLEFVL